MNNRIITTAMAAILLTGCSGEGVYFKGISDGDLVSSPLTVKMGVCGKDVKPAGEVAEGTGHHHLIVDGGCVRQGETVPKDANHLHFGKGQTEATLNLTKGAHTLTLQFADGHHASYGESMCKTIGVTVQ